MGFLRNCWYFAAWSDDVAPDAILPRTIAGESIDFFRDPEGRIAALKDMCPHRMAPLSRGAMVGDRDFWSFGPALLPSDNGAGRVRQRIDRLIAAERAFHGGSGERGRSGIPANA